MSEQRAAATVVQCFHMLDAATRREIGLHLLDRRACTTATVGGRVAEKIFELGEGIARC